jgi:hypothetical protein
MAAVGRYESVYEERSAGSNRGKRPAGADMDAGIWGRCVVDNSRSLLVEGTSCDPPGRLPMVVDWCWGWARGEGDLGGGERRGGASTGGSSTTVVLCEGVWLRDETCVTVGEAAASKSVPVRCAGTRPKATTTTTTTTTETTTTPRAHRARKEQQQQRGDGAGTYVEDTWPAPEARPSAGFS